MRALILGDIHGNLPALETVFDKERNNFDLIISHGDVVNYGPWSNECVDLLDGLENLIALKGNHEEYFIKGSYDGTHPVARAFFEFNINKFNRKDVIRAYADEYKISNYTVKHTVDNKYVFADTEVTIDKNYIIGHSHQQYSRQVNGFNLVNTGSVGQNRKYINVINYILFDAANNDIQLKYLTYDHNIIVNEFRKRGYPEICINYYADKQTFTL